MYMKLKYINLFLILIVLYSCTENSIKNSNASEDLKLTKVESESNLVVESFPFSKVIKNYKNAYTKDSITILSYDFNGFEPFLHQKDEYIYVVNFWATWCVPCVKELPYFDQLQEKYASQKVHVLLVSIDFSKVAEDVLIPFIQRQNIISEVILLDDPDGNSWIPKVDKNWSGAIPATVIYNQNERKFYERSFTFEELEKELLNFIH